MVSKYVIDILITPRLNHRIRMVAVMAATKRGFLKIDRTCVKCHAGFMSKMNEQQVVHYKVTCTFESIVMNVERV